MTEASASVGLLLATALIMIGEIRQNFTEACASVGLILATAL